jgi:hypothetical protein
MEFERLEDRVLLSGDLLVVVQDPGTNVYRLQDRTPSGAIVSSTLIPLPPGSTDLLDARGISVDPSGKTNLFNGTFTPYLSTYSFSSQTWTHRTTTGWTTINNISYGGVATFNNFVFVTDMATAGQPQNGLIRFDNLGGPTTLFATGHDFIDVTLGLDGLLYGLTDDVPNQVFVYNPQTLAAVRSFSLSSPLASDTRSIAVDSSGNIYAAAWSGELVKIDSTGANVLASTQLIGQFGGGDNLLNMGLDSDGTIAVGGRDGIVFQTNESLSSVTSFATNEWNVFVTFNHYIGSLVPSQSFWGTYGENAQHTALAGQASQSLDVIHWAVPVNLTPYTGGDILIHYGTPLITPGNTVIVPVMTATGGFQLDAINAYTGQTKWTLSTDYIIPPHNWTPSYDASLVAPNATDPNYRLYFAGAGGTLYYVDNPDSNTAPTVGKAAFYGLANYNANPNAYNSTVYINTPITADNQGDLFFGIRVTGTNPSGLASGVARMDANGNGIWVSAQSISGDPNIAIVPHQAAPALSNDQSTLYVSVRSASTSYYGYLLGLNSTTLATKYNSGILKDPRNGGVNNAGLLDDSSAAPMVGPDGKVFYGVFGNPYNGSRGWMLQFSSDLLTEYTPGAFGWDDTASIVPASMVPNYTGTSSYLIFTKYNNYVAAEVGSSGGDGVNKIAILDPNAGQTDTRNDGTPASFQVMQEILTIAGPTPDLAFINSGYPNAVREWCINSAVVDPFTKSVLVNSEDGTLYRWDLTTNTLSQAVPLSPGVGEAYTPTAMGPDGTVYAINESILDAVGRRPAMSINNVTAAEGNSGTTAFTFTVNLDYSSTQTITVNYSTADGTATTADLDYQAASGTLTFAPGVMSQTITVLVNANTAFENDETFTVNLTGPGNATIATATGVGTIQNDDPAPSLSINNVSLPEGNSGTTPFTFTVTLTGATELTTTVNYTTANGTATVANGDYQSTSGTLTFNPGGVTSQAVTVLVNGNIAYENNETFFVVLSGQTNATISASIGTGTIQNDDPAPQLAINNVTQLEGNSGTTAFTFTVTLTGATELTTTVNYATADGTAKVANGDYQATSGTLTFNPGGATSQTITVLVNSNNAFENNETFTVNLSNANNATIATATGTGTIQNDDPAPTLSINNVTMSVGTSGTTNFVFTVTLTGATELPATVNYATADGTATLAENDYASTSGQLTFNPGVTAQTITVVANGNPVFEADETFLVNLSSAVNSSIATGTGTGTIHSTAGAPPHIDYLSGVPFLGNRLLLRAINVTDPDDAIVSVSYYMETNGTQGLQTGTGGDLLLFTATSSPWNAIVLFRTGTYYAQAIDASGLLSNVVQLNLKFVPPPPPPPPPGGFGPQAPFGSAGVLSASNQSSLWNGSTDPLTWLPSAHSGHYAAASTYRVATTGSATTTPTLWDILNPFDL